MSNTNDDCRRTISTLKLHASSSKDVSFGEASPHGHNEGLHNDERLYRCTDTHGCHEHLRASEGGKELSIAKKLRRATKLSRERQPDPTYAHPSLCLFRFG